MIDYTKIKVINPEIIEHFRSHPKLIFKSEKDILLKDKILIKTIITKTYNEIDFCFQNEILYIHFKPHNFFNNNLHNANDFKTKDCIDTLKTFISTFKINPQYLSIINIEFGLNIIIPKQLITVQELLDVMIYHGLNEFRNDREFPECIYSNSFNRHGVSNTYKIIKAYCKGKRFSSYTGENTFRFEIKSKKKKYINTLNINTLQDLINPKIYNNFKTAIETEFENVLIIDENSKPILTPLQLKGFNKKLNPLTWKRYSRGSKNLFRSNFTKYYSQLNTCDNHLKKEIKNLITLKLIELNNVPIPTTID